MKFHLQRRVEQHGFPVGLIDVRLQFIHFMRPVFCDNKQRFWRNRLYMLNPFFIKPGGYMFYRVGRKPSQWVCSMTQRAQYLISSVTA